MPHDGFLALQGFKLASFWSRCRSLKKFIWVGGKKIQSPAVLLLQNSVASIAGSCVRDFLFLELLPKKYRTRAPYFYPRVKLPICNFHYNLALKNDFYHLRREIFFPPLTSSTSLSFWQRAVWWNVPSSFFFIYFFTPSLLVRSLFLMLIDECRGVWVGSPVFPCGLVQFVQSDMRLVTEDLACPLRKNSRIAYFIFGSCE